MSCVTMFVIPSFLSSQTPAGRGEWPPFPESGSVRGFFLLNGSRWFSLDYDYDYNEMDSNWFELNCIEVPRDICCDLALYK